MTSERSYRLDYVGRVPSGKAAFGRVNACTLVANQIMPRYWVKPFEEAEWAIKAAASVGGVNSSAPISFAIALG